MKEQIIAGLENPQRLEALYREDKSEFKRAFSTIYPAIQDDKTAQIWNERLNFEGSEFSWGATKDLPFVLALCFGAGLIAKIPQLTSIDSERFYPRNIGFIIFPFLIAFFVWKQRAYHLRTIVGLALAILIPAVYINVLPGNDKTDTFQLACIHVPILLWGILSYAFAGERYRDYSKRIDFLRYNGDLAVMTGLILIAGVIMTAMTINLFSMIGVRIEDIYFKYVGIWGLSSAPIIATYLVQSNPNLVGKVSPVIARIFTPLVLVMLVIYLGTVVYTGKDPYTDRDFLLLFNGLLIAVMALILFYVIEIARKGAGKIETVILFALASVTIVVNGIALSAILFRIASWGITPNRLAVMGSNVLILVHLLIVTYQLYKTMGTAERMESVKKSITTFLPIYLIWTIIVIFAFPYFFGFK
ncbi:MAG TPA: hypothetical protein VGN64_07930 [Dyadobacter sp.]|nr:hypothetical protein [Dyadobacter sp.]